MKIRLTIAMLETILANAKQEKQKALHLSNIIELSQEEDGGIVGAIVVSNTSSDKLIFGNSVVNFEA